MKLNLGDIEDKKDLLTSNGARVKAKKYDNRKNKQGLQSFL